MRVCGCGCSVCVREGTRLVCVGVRVERMQCMHERQTAWGMRLVCVGVELMQYVHEGQPRDEASVCGRGCGMDAVCA